MDTICFFEGNLPPGYTRTYSESLFSSTAHRITQSASDWLSFYILNTALKAAEAAFHVCVKEQVAYNPFRAPYGGLDCAPTLSLQVLENFIDFIESNLKVKSAHTMRVKLAPSAYSPAVSILSNILINKNYSVILKETGSVITVSDKPFKEIIHRKEGHILNRSIAKGYFSEQLSVEHLEIVYQFIYQHQQLKGYSLSMPFPDLLNTVETCAEYFKLFVTKKNEQIIAASIAILVNEHTLYNFYLAHDDNFRKDSPVLLTLEALYTYCQRHSCKVLDLGTSMLGEIINQPLLDFKRRLGAVDTDKLSFTKQLKHS